MKYRWFKQLWLFVSLCLLAGCETIPQGIQQSRLAMAASIQAEPPGNYFIGRRYYKPDYHFWGYIRQPGQRWSTAQLVVMNENRRLTPDREQLAIGSDNDCEYELYGYFSGGDPRNFHPDFQDCTPDEIRAWELAVHEANRLSSKRELPCPSGFERTGDGTVIHVLRAPFGIGVTTFPPTCYER